MATTPASTTPITWRAPGPVQSAGADPRAGRPSGLAFAAILASAVAEESARPIASARQNPGAGGLFADRARQDAAESAATTSTSAQPADNDSRFSHTKRADGPRAGNAPSDASSAASREPAQEVRVERGLHRAESAFNTPRGPHETDAAERADDAVREPNLPSVVMGAAPSYLGALASAVPGVAHSAAGKSAVAPAQTPASVPAVTPRTPQLSQQSASRGVYKAFAPRPSATDHAALASQAERAFASLLSTKGGDVRFRLDPVELGTLHVSMRITGEAVSVRIGTSTALAQGLLERTRERLRAAMESRGLSVERIEIVSGGDEPLTPIDSASGEHRDLPDAPDRTVPDAGRRAGQPPGSGTDAAGSDDSDARGDRLVRLLDAAA